MFQRKNLDQLLLCGILVALPLERIPSVRFHGANIRISQVLGALLILIVLPRLWWRRRDWLRAPWLFLGLFNFVSVVSALLNHHRGHSLKTAAFVIFVSLLAYAIGVVFDPRWLRRYAVSALSGLIGSCIFGVYQFFGDIAGLPGWLTGLRSEYMKGGIFPFPRVQSTALEPLYFDDYLLIPLSLLASFQVFGRVRRLWPATLLVIVVLTLGLSRGAQVAAAIIVITILAVAVWRRRYHAAATLVATSIVGIAVALACIGVGSYLYGGPYGRHTSAASNLKDFTKQATNVDQGESAQGRALTRKLALQATKQSPIFGIGPGDFGYYANAHSPAKFPTTTTIVNNETLELAAEEGLVGVGLMLLFATVVTIKSCQRLLSRADSTNGLAIGAILLGLAGVAAQYQLFSTLYITHIWVAIGILMGFAAASGTAKIKA